MCTPTISRSEQKFPLQKEWTQVEVSERERERAEEERKKSIRHNNPRSLKNFEPTKMCYHNKMLFFRRILSRDFARRNEQIWITIFIALVIPLSVQFFRSPSLFTYLSSLFTFFFHLRPLIVGSFKVVWSFLQLCSVLFCFHSRRPILMSKKLNCRICAWNAYDEISVLIQSRHTLNMWLVSAFATLSKKKLFIDVMKCMKSDSLFTC